MKRTALVARTALRCRRATPCSRLVPRKAALHRSALRAPLMQPFRRCARKPKPGDDRRMRHACRDQPCYLRIAGVCTGGGASSVPAHRNEGKGMGLKTPDRLTVPACGECHAEYDQGRRLLRAERRALWDAAFLRWVAARDGAGAAVVNAGGEGDA